MKLLQGKPRSRLAGRWRWTVGRDKVWEGSLLERGRGKAGYEKRETPAHQEVRAWKRNRGGPACVRWIKCGRKCPNKVERPAEE